jgi:hypothetical protein
VPGVWFALRRPRSERTLSGRLLGATLLLPAATIAIVSANHWFGSSKIPFCLARGSNRHLRLPISA